MAGLREHLRRLGPIAWRDARIEHLRRKVDEMKAQVASSTARTAVLEKELAQARRPPKYSPTEPSWHWRVQEQARVGRNTARLDPVVEYPRRRLLQKLHNYELARSHGIATPRVLGRWDRVDDIDLEGLPDRFVLKSNRGYSANGVLPLHRQGDAFRIIAGDQELSASDIVTHYESAKAVSGPFFAEEVLPGTAEVLPDDVKIYAFYGEVADILLRRVPKHGDSSSVRYRFVNSSGADLGQVQERDRSDPSIELPRDLELMADAARVLSRAVPVPFVRVDLYQVRGGIVLGELTPLPGESGGFTKEHDRYLGALYDEAEGRLNLDLARGRPFAVSFGPHNRDLTEPMGATAVL